MVCSLCTRQLVIMSLVLQGHLHVSPQRRGHHSLLAPVELTPIRILLCSQMLTVAWLVHKKSSGNIAEYWYLVLLFLDSNLISKSQSYALFTLESCHDSSFFFTNHLDHNQMDVIIIKGSKSNFLLPVPSTSLMSY